MIVTPNKTKFFFVRVSGTSSEVIFTDKEDNVTHYLGRRLGDGTEFRVPGTVLNSTYLPGTLDLVVDGVNVGSITLELDEAPTGGGGTITSVNGQTGPVVALDAEDVGALPDDYTPDWAVITGKPTEFTPSSHTHSTGEITGFSGAVSSHTDVAANTAARHTHSNSAVLDATTASFTTALSTKLSGIATGATANSSDATLLNRANHTGTQAQSTITNLTTDLAAKAPTANPTFTGTITVPDNSFAISKVSGLQTALNGKAASSHSHAIADLPANTVFSAYWTGSAWPARPTARTDVPVLWIGGTEANPPSAAVNGKDIWIRSTV